jgi:hypothetical protein
MLKQLLKWAWEMAALGKVAMLRGKPLQTSSQEACTTASLFLISGAGWGAVVSCGEVDGR